MHARTERRSRRGRAAALRALRRRSVSRLPA